MKKTKELYIDYTDPNYWKDLVPDINSFIGQEMPDITDMESDNYSHYSSFKNDVVHEESNIHHNDNSFKYHSTDSSFSLHYAPETISTNTSSYSSSTVSDETSRNVDERQYSDQNASGISNNFIIILILIGLYLVLNKK